MSRVNDQFHMYILSVTDKCLHVEGLGDYH